MMPRPALAPTLRLLLLDDEPTVRRSVERLLRSVEPSWEVCSVGTAEAAISALEAGGFDIVISDLNLGRGMSGADVLAFAQERHPDAVRLVLSGSAGAETSSRTVPTAHMVLSKPFDSSGLKAHLSRAAELRLLLSDARLRGLVGASNRLPSPPRLFHEVVTALSNPNCAVEDVAALVERDVALSAQLIRLVSSAFFGLPQRVRSVRGAVAFLGFNTVKTLVLGVSIVEQYRARRAVRGFDIDQIQLHSLRTAVMAREMLRGTGGGDEAFSAGMLHDVGQLLLAARAPDEYAEVLIRAREGQRLDLAERATFGFDHADVGAYLLGIWGLPQPLVRAVARHHRPEREVSDRFDAALAVALANKLSEDPDVPASEDPGEQPHIDLRHAREVGVEALIGSWREQARRAARNEES